MSVVTTYTRTHDRHPLRARHDRPAGPRERSGAGPSAAESATSRSSRSGQPSTPLTRPRAPTVPTRGASGTCWSISAGRAPGVQDFCLGEIALARGTSITATSNALADVLDLQHRLPLTWAVVRSGEAEVFIARRVTKLSRHLTAARVGVEHRGRAGHRPRSRRPRRSPWPRRRSSRPTRPSTTHGPRPNTRAATSGPAEPTNTACAPSSPASPPVTPCGSRPPSSGSPTSSPPPTRAPAPTSRARSPSATSPGRPSCLQLLLEHTDAPAQTQLDLGLTEAPSRATAIPADHLDALRSADLSALAPGPSCMCTSTRLHSRGADAVARVEGLGPLPLSALCTLLAAKPTVRPVRVLPRVRSTAYEHPESLRSTSTSPPLATTGRTPPPPADASTTTTRRPTPTRDHPTRGVLRRGHTTRAPSADDTTAGRRTPASARASAGRDAMSG